MKRILLILLCLAFWLPAGASMVRLPYVQDVQAGMVVGSGDAGGSYVVTKGYYRTISDGSDLIILGLYDSNHDLLDTSSAGPETSGAWQEVTFSGAVELTPGNTVYIAVMHNGYAQIAQDGVDWQCAYDTSSAYPNFPDPIGTSAENLGELSVYVANSNGDVLAGNSDVEVVGDATAGSRAYYFSAGYTVNTL